MRQDELSKVSIDGSTQCPFIMDPNNNIELKELLQFTSNNIMEPFASPLFSKLASSPQVTDFNIDSMRAQMKININSAPVVACTYALSPFCAECTTLLDRLDTPCKEISLGLEWIPGLIKYPEERALLGIDYGQTSLPHVFVNGKSIGGLFSGNPGVMPSLEDGSFLD